MSPSPIYICDLDGTLLRSDGTLSEFARRGLNELVGSGARLTVATSRATPAIRALLAGVDLRLPVIEMNGAHVSELPSGRHLHTNALPRPAARAAVEIIESTGADPVVSAWDGSGDRVYFGPRRNPGTGWYVDEKRAYGDPRLTECRDLLRAAGEGQVASVVGFVPDAGAGAVARELAAAVAGAGLVYAARNYYCPGWSELLVQHPAAEKGAAVPALLEAAEMGGAEVVACGDHLNDLGLFAAAARSIAPANAHPEVLERASLVVESNDEDGIVRHLLDLHGLS